MEIHRKFGGVIADAGNTVKLCKQRNIAIFYIAFQFSFKKNLNQKAGYQSFSSTRLDDKYMIRC